jgi:SOS-response transcriptional repressor LexA
MSARVLCRKEECPLFPLPLNPAFEPITLEPEDADALTIVGEFVGTIA